MCGLLFGDFAHIRAAEPAANIHPDPGRFFELDPASLFGALRRERKGGPALIGHYHSHPGGRAEPSVIDAAAADPASGLLWLILGDGKAGLFRAVPGGPIHGVFAPLSLVPD